MSMHSDEVTLRRSSSLSAAGWSSRPRCRPSIASSGDPAPAFTLEEATFATAASVLPVPPPSLTALHLTSPLAFALAFAPTNVAKVCVEHASLAPAPSDPARNPGRSTRVRRPPTLACCRYRPPLLTPPPPPSSPQVSLTPLPAGVLPGASPFFTLTSNLTPIPTVTVTLTVTLTLTPTTQP